MFLNLLIFGLLRLKNFRKRGLQLYKNRTEHMFMKEKTFLTLSLSVSLLGILALFFLSSFFHYGLVAIQDLSMDSVGKTVYVEGVIGSLRNTGQTYLFTLSDDTGDIPIVLYSKKDLNFPKNALIDVTGTVIDYQCTLEIQANEITLAGS